MKSRLIYILLIPIAVMAETAREFIVIEREGHVELDTPWGVKTIMGDFMPENQANYRFEIPLQDLKPEAALLPEPSPTPEATPPATPPKAEISDANKSKTVVETVEEEVEDDGGNAAAREVTAATPPRMIVEYDETDKLVVEANRLYNKGKFYDAINVVEELLRKRPDYVRGWLMKGSLMKLKGHKDLAKNAWEKALSLDPKNQEIASLLKNFK